MSSESIGKTILIATVVALLCSLMVSGAVYYLRPMQLVYTRIVQNRAIIEAAGLVAANERISDREVIGRFLELDARIVDLSNGAYMDAIDALSFDQRASAADPELSEAIPESRDIARLKSRSRFAPVYLLMDGNTIERIILPVHGQGMWSRIYGYIALAPDLNTIVAVRFYEHGETPGIGDRIQDPGWTSRWSGKRVYDQDGGVALQVMTEDTESPYRIDAISGATVTAESVGKLIQFWLGSDGFGPLIARLREARDTDRPEE